MDAVQKAKFEQRMVLLLLVIFVAALFHTLKRLGVIGGKRAPGAPPGATTATAPADDRVAGALATTVQQMQQHEAAIQQFDQGTAPPIPVVEYAAEEARDPLRSVLLRPSPESSSPSPARAATSSAGSATPKPPAVTIQGVIVGERPQAIIDRTLYSVGDTVNGVARIVAIERDGVTMEVQGVRFLVSPTGSATLVNPVGGER